jgi:hypothetical protein
MTLRAMAAEELDLPPANSLVQNVDDVSRMSSFLQGTTFATMQLPDPYSTSDSTATSRDTSMLSSTEERKKIFHWSPIRVSQESGYLHSCRSSEEV